MLSRVQRIAQRTSSRFAHSAAASYEANDRFRVVVVGGGCGGLTIASSLADQFGPDQVCVIDGADSHYYQPLWTLVGAGIKPFWQSQRRMSSVMPQNVTWVPQYATEFVPEQNQVKTAGGETITYDQLVVAPGAKITTEGIKGLAEALEANDGVSTNYSPKYVQNTFKNIQQLKKGKALFTFPSTPIKCAGAPQKIMYLAEDFWRRQAKCRDDVDVEYYCALPGVFSSPVFAARLTQIQDERDIHRHMQRDLVEVRHQSKEAVFQKLGEGEEGVEVVDYDMMHVAPRMTPHPFVAQSPLANEAGWVDVDKFTLRHNKFDNVWSLGDASSLPTSKTAAAIAGQSGILKANLRAAIAGMRPLAHYDGYTSCPLTVSYDKLLLAEFDYSLAPLPTFPVDQSVENSAFMALKTEVFPEMYWNAVLTGSWEGVANYRSVMSPLRALGVGGDTPSTVEEFHARHG